MNSVRSVFRAGFAIVEGSGRSEGEVGGGDWVGLGAALGVTGLPEGGEKTGWEGARRFQGADAQYADASNRIGEIFNWPS